MAEQNLYTHIIYKASSPVSFCTHPGSCPIQSAGPGSLNDPSCHTPGQQQETFEADFRKISDPFPQGELKLRSDWEKRLSRGVKTFHLKIYSDLAKEPWIP